MPATAERRSLVAEQVRYVTHEDAALHIDYPLAREWTTDTLLDAEADAQALADADFTFWSAPRRPWSVTVDPNTAIKPGVTIRLVDEIEFPSGKDFFVSSLTVVIAGQQEKYELRLIG